MKFNMKQLIRLVSEETYEIYTGICIDIESSIDKYIEIIDEELEKDVNVSLDEIFSNPNAKIIVIPKYKEQLSKLIIKLAELEMNLPNHIRDRNKLMATHRGIVLLRHKIIEQGKQHIQDSYNNLVSAVEEYYISKSAAVRHRNVIENMKSLEELKALSNVKVFYEDSSSSTDLFSDFLKNAYSTEKDTLEENTSSNSITTSKIFDWKDMEKLALQNKFDYKSSNGDHRIYERASDGKIVIIPAHKLGIGLSLKIQKDILI